MKLDYVAMTTGERMAAIAALSALLGDEWRQVPAHVQIDRVADLLAIPTMTKPVRVTSQGEILVRMRLIDITDANRWAVIFLAAVSDRLDLTACAPYPEKPEAHRD